MIKINFQHVFRRNIKNNFHNDILKIVPIGIKIIDRLKFCKKKYRYKKIKINFIEFDIIDLKQDIK